MQLSSLWTCEIIIVMCFDIVDLNYFPLQIIFVKLTFFISLLSFLFFFWFYLSVFFHWYYFILLLLILFLYGFAVQAQMLFLRCEALCFFGSVGVQKLFNSVNEHITQWKATFRLPKHDRMVCSIVNKLDTKKILCLTYF